MAKTTSLPALNAAVAACVAPRLVSHPVTFVAPITHPAPVAEALRGVSGMPWNGCAGAFRLIVFSRDISGLLSILDLAEADSLEPLNELIEMHGYSVGRLTYSGEAIASVVVEANPLRRASVAEA